MVQFGGISLLQYVMPVFSLLFIIFGTLLPIWNIRFIGGEGRIPHNFPYPFSLIFLEFLFSTFIFCIFNMIQRFIIPHFVAFLAKDTAKSIFKVNTIRIDPFTKQTLAFYGGDQIRRPGLFQAVDFNVNNAYIDAEIDDFEQLQQEQHVYQKQAIVQRESASTSTVAAISNSSIISGLSQITQFSVGTDITLHTNYTDTTGNADKIDVCATKTSVGPTQQTLAISFNLFNKSWCFDSNFSLKLGLTFKSGILFGVTAWLFMAAQLFVPISLDILIHSGVLLLITMYAKLTNIERIDFASIIFASLAVLSIIPFCIHPFDDDTLYFANKKVINGEQYILISVICDFLGAVCIFFAIISISNLCLSIKPSKMRFDADSEPSIVELSFFICLWSTFICLFPCIVCDILFKSQNILTTNIPAANSTVFTVNILLNICISIVINSFYIFSFIACLSIMTILSISILYQFIVLTHAVLYFNLIEKHWQLQIYHTLSLMCAYISCFIYLIVRFIENKRHSKLTWNQYLTRQDRINSNESFNTLLSRSQQNLSQNTKFSTTEINNHSGFEPFPNGLNNSFNGSVHHIHSGINYIHRIKNPEYEQMNESIMSLPSEDDSADIDENGNIIDYATYFTPTESSKRFHGPNMHNNRYGLPAYIRTPPAKQVQVGDDEEQDILFHSNLIKGNIEYYEKNKSNVKKRKSKKRKSKNLNKVRIVQRTASFDEREIDYINN